MIIKYGISITFIGIVSDKVTIAKTFHDEIEKCFVKNNKVKTNTLLDKLVSLKCKAKESIQEYIMEISHPV